jgi:hypothetical protein
MMPTGRARWTFAITSAALFTFALDRLVVVTALPAIRADLGAGSSFTVGLAVFTAVPARPQPASPPPSTCFCSPGRFRASAGPSSPRSLTRPGVAYPTLLPALVLMGAGLPLFWTPIAAGWPVGWR